MLYAFLKQQLQAIPGIRKECPGYLAWQAFHPVVVRPIIMVMIGDISGNVLPFCLAPFQASLDRLSRETA